MATDEPPPSSDLTDVSLSDRTTSPRASRDGSPPTRLGPYRLVHGLGAGGMGEVHEAIDTRNNQRVALKMLFEIDPAGVYRLKREFRRMADISHENLVALHELGHDDGRWYYTMELLGGTDLSAALQAARASGDADLRRLVRQLAHGVHALHQAGKIHRDLKPSNVLVTDEGRLVILDFGLVNEIDNRTLFASSRGLVRGTPGYMAPEQAAGQLATPAADWYAVGAILFEAVTGRLPFVGSVMQIILDKQDFDAPRVRTRAPEVSEELEALIAALLERSPSARPGVTEILAWCSGDRGGASLSLPRRVDPGGLIEREAHLEVLRRAYADVLAGRPCCVDIVGAAGTGKTALVRQFIAQLASDRLLELTGTCSARESVPYRAFDGLVDAIAGHLLRIPGAECDALIHDLGHELYALAQIFPVLARVAWINQQTPASVPGPGEMRRRGFAGLKQLLFRIAEQRPLIVFLDNLQWGDLDSARLLDDLLAPPGTPAFLLICAYRGDEPSPMLRDLALLRALVTPAYALTTLETPPLSQSAATRLAVGLMGDPPTPARIALAQRVAREAAGIPALVRALVEEIDRPGADIHASLAHDGGGGLLRRLVRARLSRVVPDAREVLGRIAVASGLRVDQLMRAEAWRGDVRALVTQLRAQGLVRSEGDGDAMFVVPFTEPIQQAALATLEPVLVQRCHVSVARLLLADASEDYERIARHLHAGGLPGEAVEHATAAALAAGKALAFDHAAELYRFALTCSPGKWTLQKRCAVALVDAGRGAEAAPLFLAAAESAPATAAGRLRRDAAEQYLGHGYLDRGLEILRPLLQSAGFTVPERPRDLNAQLVANTDRVVRRGFAFDEHSEFEIPSRELDRIDLLWTAGKGLILGDPIRSADFLAQSTYLSLEAGEPRRAARGLALFGMLQTSRGQGGDLMLAEADRLAQKTRDHYAIGLGHISRGIVARTDGKWLPALADLDFGVQYLREHCPGTAWECSLGQGSTMAALEALGELRCLSQRAEALLRQAQELGDMHSAVLAAMYSALALLARGRPADARARVHDAQSHWSRTGFHVQHLHALKLEVACDLYEQRPHDAWARIVATWTALEDSNFLRISARRSEALILRARAALAVYRRSPGEHAHLLDVVEMDAGQLAQENRTHLSAEAALLRAGLAACKGDAAASTRHLGAAVSGFEAANMHLSAIAVRRLRATKDVDIARQDALMRMQDIGDPVAWTRVVAPGLVS